MRVTTASALLGALLSTYYVRAAPVVDTMYPYTGPDVPVGDWVNPISDNPTNNINVISLSYIPEGINIHYQTPFGLGVAPSVSWGTSATTLNQNASGTSHT
jgi:ribosomal protein L2